MIYEHTEVFTIKSLDQLLTFCRKLLQMKREAPRSLTFTVALTAIRQVQFLGSEGKPRHVGEDLRDLSLELDGGCALPVAAPIDPTERRTRPRRSRRRADPAGH